MIRHYNRKAALRQIFICFFYASPIAFYVFIFFLSGKQAVSLFCCHRINMTFSFFGRHPELMDMTTTESSRSIFGQSTSQPIESIGTEQWTGLSSPPAGNEWKSPSFAADWIIGKPLSLSSPHGNYKALSLFVAAESTLEFLSVAFGSFRHWLPAAQIETSFVPSSLTVLLIPSLRAQTHSNDWTRWENSQLCDLRRLLTRQLLAFQERWRLRCWADHLSTWPGTWVIRTG